MEEKIKLLIEKYENELKETKGLHAGTCAEAAQFEEREYCVEEIISDLKVLLNKE